MVCFTQKFSVGKRRVKRYILLRPACNALMQFGFILQVAQAHLLGNLTKMISHIVSYQIELLYLLAVTYQQT